MQVWHNIPSEKASPVPGGESLRSSKWNGSGSRLSDYPSGIAAKFKLQIIRSSIWSLPGHGNACTIPQWCSTAHSTVCWQLAQSEVYLFPTNGSLPTLSLLEGTMSPQSQGTLALFGPVESTGESGTLAEIGSSMWQEWWFPKVS